MLLALLWMDVIDLANDKSPIIYLLQISNLKSLDLIDNRVHNKCNNNKSLGVI